MKNKKSQLFAWGLALGVLDLGVIGLGRAFAWTLHPPEWLPYSSAVLSSVWCLLFLGLAWSRGRLGLWVENALLWATTHQVLRSERQTWRQLLAKGNAEGGWTAAVWSERREELRRSQQWQRLLWTRGATLGALACAALWLQPLLATCVFALGAWSLRRPKTKTTPAPAQADHALEERWLIQQKNAWPHSAQKALYQYWAKGRLQQERQRFESLYTTKVKAAQAEFNAQILSALAIVGAATAARMGWMTWNDTLAFGLCLLLAHKPLKDFIQAREQIKSSLAENKRAHRRHTQAQKKNTPTRSGISLSWLRIPNPQNQQVYTGRVAPAECLRVRGPSGSGKSTLLQHLAGLQSLTQGHVIWPQQGAVLYLPQGIVAPALAPEQWHAWRSTPRAQEWAEALDLQDILVRMDALMEQQQYSTPLLSGGEEQRLALWVLGQIPACAWILDEPFARMPAQDAIRYELWIRKQAQKEHLCLVIASHHDCPLDQDTKEFILDPNSKATFERCSN